MIYLDRYAWEIGMENKDSINDTLTRLAVKNPSWMLNPLHPGDW